MLSRRVKAPRVCKVNTKMKKLLLFSITWVLSNVFFIGSASTSIGKCASTTKPLSGDAEVRIISHCDSDWRDHLLDNKVQHLEIINTNFRNITSDTFKDLDSLESLKLSNNQAAACISAALDILPKLASLVLLSNNFQNCPVIFNHTSSLKSITIQQKQIPANIVNLMPHSLVELKIFDTPIISDKLTIERNYSNLKELTMTNCSLQELGIRVIMPSLQKLNLSNNHIQNDNIKFDRLDNLEELDLSYNNYKIHINFNFALLPKLKMISLRGNQLKYIDSDTFINNSNLETVILSENRLKKIGLLYTVNDEKLRYKIIATNNSLDCEFLLKYGETLQLKDLPISCFSIWWKIMAIIIGILIFAILLSLLILYLKRRRYNKIVMAIAKRKRRLTVQDVNTLNVVISMPTELINSTHTLELIERPYTSESDETVIEHRILCCAEDQIVESSIPSTYDDENLYDIPRFTNYQTASINNGIDAERESLLPPPPPTDDDEFPPPPNDVEDVCSAPKDDDCNLYDKPRSSSIDSKDKKPLNVGRMNLRKPPAPPTVKEDIHDVTPIGCDNLERADSKASLNQ